MSELAQTYNGCSQPEERKKDTCIRWNSLPYIMYGSIYPSMKELRQEDCLIAVK